FTARSSISHPHRAGNPKFQIQNPKSIKGGSDVATETSANAPVRVRRRINLRQLIIAVVILIGLGAAATVGYNYWRDAALYISTDDALVDTTMATVTASGAGTLVTWRVQPGAQVRSGQAIGVVKAQTGAAGAPLFNITAPIDGMLIRVDAKEGQLVV